MFFVVSRKAPWSAAAGARTRGVDNRSDAGRAMFESDRARPPGRNGRILRIVEPHAGRSLTDRAQVGTGTSAFVHGSTSPGRPCAEKLKVRHVADQEARGLMPLDGRRAASSAFASFVAAVESVGRRLARALEQLLSGVAIVRRKDQAQRSSSRRRRPSRHRPAVPVERRCARGATRGVGSSNSLFLALGPAAG